MPVNPSRAISFQSRDRATRCARKSLIVTGSRIKRAIAQRRKLSVAGDTSSRTARPITKLLDQSNAVRTSVAYVGSSANLEVLIVAVRIAAPGDRWRRGQRIEPYRGGVSRLFPLVVDFVSSVSLAFRSAGVAAPGRSAPVESNGVLLDRRRSHFDPPGRSSLSE